jgi:hypothetical protein
MVHQTAIIMTSRQPKNFFFQILHFYTVSVETVGENSIKIALQMLVFKKMLTTTDVPTVITSQTKQKNPPTVLCQSLCFKKKLQVRKKICLACSSGPYKISLAWSSELYITGLQDHTKKV